MPLTADQIADQADGLKTGYLAITLALPVIVDPRLHILAVHCRYYGQTPTSVFDVVRHDGTVHPSETIGAILTRATKLPGAGLGGGLLLNTAMFGAVRLGDELKLAGIDPAGEPLLQFARHFRNACAHGNRWHFQGREPKEPAELRGRALDPSLHGTQALNCWVHHGDFCDYLDDLAALLRTL